MWIILSIIKLATELTQSVIIKLKILTIWHWCNLEIFIQNGINEINCSCFSLCIFSVATGQFKIACGDCGWWWPQHLQQENYRTYRRLKTRISVCELQMCTYMKFKTKHETFIIEIRSS